MTGDSNSDGSNPSNANSMKQYRAFSLNPPRKRPSILQNQSSEELTRNFILSKMNHKIRNLTDKDSNGGHGNASSITDILSNHERELNKRRNSNLLMKKKDDVQRRRNIDVLSKFDSSSDYNLRGVGQQQSQQNNDHTARQTSNVPSAPSVSSHSDPLMTSLISRLKMMEEKVKTLEGSVKNKDLELKRVKRLGREHKAEGRAYHNRMEELLTLVASMSEYMSQELPNHPFPTQIKSVKLFSQKFHDEGFKITTTKEFNFGLDKNSVTTKDETDEFNTQEIVIDQKESRVVNIPLLKQRIEALNSTISEDYEIIQTKDGMAKFKERKSVPIIFFSNGIIVDSGSFRPYEWDITKAFLIDILDGYFPFEFKETYPNGIRLELVDKSNEQYTRSKATQQDIVSGNIRNLDDLKGDFKQNVPKNKKEFLEKLPKQVVKDGKVINVRQNIASMLGDSMRDSNLKEGQKEVTCNTECYAEVFRCKENNESVPRHALIRLKLPKLADTSLETIHIYLYPNQTIGELRKHIDSQINPNQTLNYSLRCWPNVRLEENSKTVEEAGLVPNVNLFLHLL